MYAVQIVMPSAMTSRPRECEDQSAAEKLMSSFVSQMKTWVNFEAWVLLLEHEKEINIEYVKA